MRWHQHAWTPWSDPVDMDVVYIRYGKQIRGVETTQRRRCPGCGMVEERVI